MVGSSRWRACGTLTPNLLPPAGEGATKTPSLPVRRSRSTGDLPLHFGLPELTGAESVSASAPGNAPVFELKSAPLVTVALLLKTTDPQALAAALAQEFGDSPDMFDHDPVLLDLAAVREAPETPDFSAIRQLLRGYRLNLVAVRGGSEAQMQAALAADLSLAPDAPVPAAKPAAPKRGETPSAPVAAAPAQETASAAAPSPGGDAAESAQLELLPRDETAAAAPVGAAPAGSPASREDAAPATPGRHDRAVPASDSNGAPAADAADSAAAGLKPANPLRPTLVVDRPLRSGQQVYARGADLVVLASVNFGAEVIADGHIHVYAPLRGRAVAGARGDTSARIFCTSMQAQLLSIAGTYRTTDTPLPQGLHGKPVQVRLDGETLVIEALNLE